MQNRIRAEEVGCQAEPMPGTDWASELKDGRRWVRRRAACALAKMPHFARRVPEVLAEALLDPDPQTRRWAAQALANVVPPVVPLHGPRPVFSGPEVCLKVQDPSEACVRQG